MSCGGKIQKIMARQVYSIFYFITFNIFYFNTFKKQGNLM